MGMCIISLAYGDVQIEDTPLHRSLVDLEYDGDVHLMQADGFVSNRQRMFHYRAALQAEPAEFDTVILSDARDVVFQYNPEGLVHAELEVYLEDGARTMAACPINRRNYIAEYGQEAFAEVAERPISCAGVVIGTRAGVMRYLDSFCAAIEASSTDEVWSQPIHNHLLWTGQLDPVRIVDNDEGPVYTVGHCAELRVRNHQIVNGAGQVPVIVHQFDRHLQVL